MADICSKYWLIQYVNYVYIYNHSLLEDQIIQSQSNRFVPFSIHIPFSSKSTLSIFDQLSNSISLKCFHSNSVFHQVTHRKIFFNMRLNQKMTTVKEICFPYTIIEFKELPEKSKWSTFKVKYCISLTLINLILKIKPFFDSQAKN